MQATVQPPHDELLYQCYVTEELEKPRNKLLLRTRSGKATTVWGNH